MGTFVVTTRRGTSNLFTFVSIKDAFMKAAAFIGGLLFLTLMMTMGWMFLEMIAPPQGKVVDSGHVDPTREQLKNAHRYHGILFAREDDNHEWYFVRDGKRCKLFAYKDSKPCQK